MQEQTRTIELPSALGLKPGDLIYVATKHVLKPVSVPEISFDFEYKEQA